ncbi:MAG: FtsX-like permease family protein [Alkalibacterium sp.]|uniref:ABC transporter permease n=1 Tax=Alkalibacterium sp. TaxID=1872447 RepID=UPI00397087CC
MYYKLIKNDFQKSKAVTLTTVFFVAAAAMLVSLAMILVINLTGAIDSMMTKAETPHFMQMHAGELDMERLNVFAEESEFVEEFQVLEFLNLEGARIVLADSSLAQSLQDNGVSSQSEKFDYLLDLDDEIITAEDGELYVPINYMREGLAVVGDRALISGKEFTVSGFLRDSQMNSTLSSSKRFLVSDNDFEELRSSGSIEYLIEFRLDDLSALGAFESEYNAAGLEANGPTITYPLFRLINSISDGMMIAVILLVSIMVVLIAFVSIRFTLLAKIEEDYREIGVMKAIGLRLSDIKRIYLAKYAAIALVGSAIGYALSFLFKDLLLVNIRLFMGESDSASLAPLFGALGVFIIALTIMIYVNRVLKRFKKISAAEAIRFGTARGKSHTSKRLLLSENKLFNPNIFLGVKDVLARKGLYATMLAVLVISAFIMIVPQNLYNTISSKDFITYMGIGRSDMRIDIQQTDNIAEKTAQVADRIGKDTDVDSYALLTTKTYDVIMEDGSTERLIIELGDHLQFPLEYAEGSAPVAEDEVSLSEINARELEKVAGDSITLLINGAEKDFTISGVYSDVTNGGKTAKAAFDDDTAETMWSIVNIELADASTVESKAQEYQDSFGFAKVSAIDEYVLQTYGSTINSVGTAAYAAAAIALSISVLVTLLFMKMLVAKERYAIAVMKAFGYTSRDIRMQFASRAVFVLLVGAVTGTLLANTLGQLLAGQAIAYVGASSFSFTVNPVLSYLLSPMLMLSFVMIATVAGTADIGQIKISENIKE